jgi:hypothetical protein
MKQNRLSSLYVLIVASAIAACGLCVVTVFYIYFAVGAVAVFSGCSPSDITELENAGQFKLPPSAQHLKSDCFGMQGWDGQAEFDMAPSDLNVFVTSTKLESPLSNDGLLKDDGLATLSSQAKSYLHGRYDSYVTKTDTTYYQEVLVDTTNPTQYHVYIKFGGD